MMKSKKKSINKTNSRQKSSVKFTGCKIDSDEMIRCWKICQDAEKAAKEKPLNDFLNAASYIVDIESVEHCFDVLMTLIKNMDEKIKELESQVESIKDSIRPLGE